MTTKVDKNKKIESGFGINKLLVVVSIILGLMLLTFISFAGYYFAYHLPKQQRESFAMEKKQLEDEKNVLVDTIDALNKEKAELLNKVETKPTQVVNKVNPTPQPNSDTNVKARCVSFKIGVNTFTRCK